MSRDFGQQDKPVGVLADRPVATNANFKDGKHSLVLSGIVFLVLAAAAAAFYFTHPKEVAKAKSDDSMVVLTVSTAPAYIKNIDRHLSVNGSISAWDPLSIGAELSQLRVDSIKVEEGDQVKEGQVLATLNSTVLRAQLAQQKAHLAADEAALRKAVQPNRVEDLNTWRAALKQSEANLAQEEANLLRVKANAANSQENAHRYTELRKLGAVSQMDAETKFTDAKSSTADVSAGEKKVEALRYALRQANEKLKMAEQGGRQEDIIISQATLEETRAKLNQLEAQVEQTIIRAPAAGKIVKREVHLGEISSVGKNMFTMVRNNRMELRALVPEIDLPRIVPGMEVKMTSNGDGNQSVVGRVREVSPSVDEKTRLGMARIDLPKSASWMKPGLFYHADIDLGKQKMLLVPSKAVLNRNEKDVVFVFNGDHAVLRPVKVGEPLAEGAIEVLSGLKPGEEVIVSGAGFMKDGDKVRAVSEGSASKR